MDEEFKENVKMAKAYVSNISKNYKELRKDIKDEVKETIKDAKSMKI